MRSGAKCPPPPYGVLPPTSALRASWGERGSILFLPPANVVSVGGRAGVAGRGAVDFLITHLSVSRLASHVLLLHD
jgi:hypothetical protein